MAHNYSLHGDNMNERKNALKAWHNDTANLFIFLLVALICMVGISTYFIFPDKFFWNRPQAVEIDKNPVFIEWQDEQAVYELNGTIRRVDRNEMGIIIIAKPKGKESFALQVDGYPDKVKCKFIKADLRNAWSTNIYIGNRTGQPNQTSFEIYAIATTQDEANHLLDIDTKLKIAGKIPTFENRNLVEQLLNNQIWSKKITVDFP